MDQDSDSEQSWHSKLEEDQLFSDDPRQIQIDKMLRDQLVDFAEDSPDYETPANNPGVNLP